MPIEIERLSQTYPSADGREICALRDISLRLEDGAFVGIMGRTGCGKTTLIRLIAGLLAPTRGRVLLDGNDINAKGFDRSLLRRSVGVVFQNPEYQLFETTVERDVAFGLKYSGLSRAEVAERVSRALNAMGFDFGAVRGQSPLALSGGEKRRAAIAGVLAAQPKILIFDEPVAGLDPKAREAFLSLVSDLNREGTTVLMVSHSADALAECVKQLVVLDRGRIALQGPAREVFSQLPQRKELHAGVSAAQEIAGLLSARGVRLPEGIIGCGELRSALISALKGGGCA